MDFNLRDISQRFGSSHGLFSAAEAGAVKRFIFVRVVIDITSSRAQHTEGCLARKVQRQNRRGDFVLADRDNLVNVLAHHVKRNIAGVLDCDAVGKCAYTVKRDGFSGFQRALHAGGVLRLHAVDFYLGV